MDKLNIIIANESGDTESHLIGNVNPEAEEISLAAWAKTYASIGNDTLTKLEKITRHKINLPQEVAGDDLDNVIICNDFQQTIYPQGGNDQIFLGPDASQTTIIYSKGNDSIYGFKDNDTLLFPDTVNAVFNNTNLTATTDQGNVYLGGYRYVIAKGNIKTESGVAIPINETLKTTSAAENITISKVDGDIQVLCNGAVVQHVYPGSNITAFDAGAGDDTILVDSSMENAGFEVWCSKTNDSINIVGHGNVYYYDAGHSKDTIVGWGSNDTFKINYSSYSTLMSPDGNDFIVKVGPGKITFKGLVPGTDKVKIQLKDNAVQEVPVPKLMFGTTSAETLSNIYVAATEDSPAIEPKSGTSSTDYWVIDASNGNDTIINEGSYVSIYGGVGSDKIFINAHDGKVTEGVSINGGAGNDTIDVTGDVAGTVKGAHVYTYGIGEGNDVIVGYNPNDTIRIAGFNSTTVASTTVDKTIQQSSIEADTQDFVLKVGNGSVKIVKPEGSYLGGEKLTIVDADNNSVIPFYSIPKALNFGATADLISITPDMDHYTISSGAGNDSIYCYASYCSILTGTGNDLVSLCADSSFCTILSTQGNDSIFPNNDSHSFDISSNASVFAP